MSDPLNNKWIQTASGRAFYPLSPRVEDVCVKDIAHALAMKCRFTGHTRYFYSVAQHSVLVSRAVPSQDAMWGLMHDAAEAYLPDVARPIKRALMGFREIEDMVLAVVAAHVGLSFPIPESVHAADLVLLATERRDLMPFPPHPWVSTENVSPLPDKINPLGPMSARMMFERRFEELKTVLALAGRKVA